MNKIKNLVSESCSFNSLFWRENRFPEDFKVDIWPPKLTLNFKSALFFAVLSLLLLKISFEDVDFYAKLSLILDTAVRNSTTQKTIILQYLVVTAEQCLVVLHSSALVDCYHLNIVVGIGGSAY